LDFTRADGKATFIEMGFDSLMLTQASQAIEKRFGTRVAFSQLMGKYSSFDLLAIHIGSAASATTRIASITTGSADDPAATITASARVEPAELSDKSNETPKS